jgi:hypothetical protein
VGIYRSTKYKKWVKQQPCIICENPEVDPHHIKGIGHLSGCAMKAPDWALIPLCSRHHEEVQRSSTSDQWEWALRTLGQAIEQGVFK